MGEGLNGAGECARLDVYIGIEHPYNIVVGTFKGRYKIVDLWVHTYDSFIFPEGVSFSESGMQCRRD